MTDRYQIISLIEKDQLGSVYMAQDTTLQRKVIFRDFEKAKSDKNPEEFSQYTGKLCALQHPNLLTIYDISIEDDGYFMVTQFLEEESLEQRLAQGALSQVGVHNMACDLLDAMHAAHSSGLFHGALRTDSIKRLARVRGGHRYLIVDFGLDRISAMICGTHVIMADPVLMAPELVNHQQEPDGQSDLFTLGQLCYISLVGGHPYAGKTPKEREQAYKDGGLPHLNTYVQGIQPEFADWVMWLVSGPKDQRPSSSLQAMEALHAIKINAPSPNVPGVTQAVKDIPVLPDPNLPKISKPVRVSTEPEKKPVKKSSPPKVRKEGRFMFAAVGMVIVLLVVLILVLMLRIVDDKTNGGVTAEVVVPLVEIQKTELINRMLTTKSPVIIEFDTEKNLDWTVVTGAPASSARLLMKGGLYIRNILALGEFTEYIDLKSSISYRAGGADILPQRCITSSRQGNAQVGEGWRVDLLIPEKHQGGLLVTLYMIQSHCDFEIEVRSTHEKNKEKVEKMKIPNTHPGVVKIPLKIEAPDQGYYSIRVQAASKSAISGFEMGLSAVQIEKL